jgi:phosphatidylglycerophosphate synthase
MAWEPFLPAGLFGVTVAIVAARRAHHPFPRFGPANQTTTVRALLVALVAGFIGGSPTPAAAILVVAIAAAATVLDGVDGWLARRTRMASAFGARFDMEIDALLILVLAVLAWRYGKAGAWVVLSGLLRYAFVLGGWLWPWMRKPLPSSTRGKVMCVTQIVALVIVLLPGVEPPLSGTIAAVALAALAYSFLVDTMWLWAHR